MNERGDRLAGGLLRVGAVLMIIAILMSLPACKGAGKAVRAASRSADDLAGAAGRAGARASDNVTVPPGLVRAGVRALPRHSSWAAWADFDEAPSNGKGLLRFGIYDSGSGKPVSASGKVTVVSTRDEKGEEYIHSEEFAFVEAEAAAGPISRASVAPWRTWAGATSRYEDAEFWIGIYVESGGRGIRVAGQSPPG